MSEQEKNLKVMVVSGYDHEGYVKLLNRRGFQAFGLTADIVLAAYGDKNKAKEFFDDVAVVFIDAPSSFGRLEENVQGLMQRCRTNVVSPEYLRTYPSSYGVMDAKRAILPDESLSKPVVPDELFDKVSRALERYKTKLQRQS